AAAWCQGTAADRRCPEDLARTVREVAAEEAPLLMKQPDNPYPVIERVAVSVGKTPYVRFDLNDYSIPHTHVQRTLTVLAEPDTLRIVEGQTVIATHRRSYDKGAQIENPEHIQALVGHKRQGRHHRATDRLAQAAPASRDLLMRAAERGDNIGAITSALTNLLDRYGAAELQAAIIDALAKGVPHHNAVRQVIERRRDDRGQVPPVAVILPAHVQARDRVVRTGSLEIYDKLVEANHDDEP
ncbi:MAG: hypothetical protein WCJ64_26465, partial [Rhodospirillaceae bacterium]